VGIAWQDNPQHKWDRHRSLPLAQFAPLAAVPGVHLLNLQKGPGCEQLRALQGRFPVTDFGDELDATAGAFMDTAAVIANLDLVITTDTALAHLAGALGAPVWVALSTVVDWRWLLGRDDSPWYPSLRLFRQRALGDWPEVFGRMAQELEQRVRTSQGGRSVLVEIAPGELLDKLTILHLKAARITDAAKLRHVRAELVTLEAARARSVPGSVELARLEAELQAVNAALWEIEDALRLCEREQDFGPRFIDLARSVYRHNDARAALKRQINALLGAPFAEQKAYAAYACAPR
jgi:hypothetical protein